MSIPQIFSRKKILANRERAMRRGDFFLLEQFAEILVDRLSDFSRQFNNILIVGDRGGVISSKIKSSKICEIDENEVINIKNNDFDLIISFLDLHTINDIPGVLMQMRNLLKDEGLLIASMFGEKTLQELRECFIEAEMAISDGLSPRFNPVIDVKTAGSLLQRAGFKNPVADSDMITILYDNMKDIVEDLRSVGETGSMLKRHYLRREIAALAEGFYKEKFNKNNSLPVSFEIISLLGVR